MNKKAEKSKNSGPTLDLHGVTEDEVFNLIESFLAKNSSAKSVRLMPGKGKGIVKKKLIEYLKLAKYAWAFEKSADGKMNEGVLVVHL